MLEETAECRTENSIEFSTAFESMDSENRTAKEAGLSKEEAVSFEIKECASALNAALLKEDVSEDDRHGIIRKHLDLLLPAVNATAAMYA